MSMVLVRLAAWALVASLIVVAASGCRGGQDRQGVDSASAPTGAVIIR